MPSFEPIEHLIPTQCGGYRLRTNEERRHRTFERINRLWYPKTVADFDEILAGLDDPQALQALCMRPGLLRRLVKCDEAREALVKYHKPLPSLWRRVRDAVAWPARILRRLVSARPRALATRSPA